MKVAIRRMTLMALLLVIFVEAIRSQNCEYTLEMIDFGGDGWNNGAGLFIKINEDSSFYKLDDITDNGSYKRVNISVEEGDNLVLSYQSGGIQDIENAYTLYDSEGFEVISQGVFPMAGTVYSDIIQCPNCSVSANEGVFIQQVKSTTAQISLEHPNENGTLVVFLREEGDPSGLLQEYKNSGNQVNIAGLKEHTLYEIQVGVVCSIGDTSRILGPNYFTTRRTVDVGVSDITMPESSCDLEANEEITVTFTNYGANPQALFDFKFSVDGEEANINIPLDGFYTGVLGMDSSYTISFDQTFDFSEKKTYEVKAWTEVPEDSNIENDTFTILVTSIPLIDEYPYSTSLEESQDGWTTLPVKGSIWEYGEPDGSQLIGAASGIHCWATNLDGFYINDQVSYLYSPCLDFSSIISDPYFSFSMWLGLEENYDFLWLEASTDDGITWEKINTRASDLNGYNNTVENAWTGTGSQSFSSWQYSSIRLLNLAGEPSVRLRFVLRTDEAVTGEGVGLDNFAINEPYVRDAVALTAVNVQNLNCGSTADQIRIDYANRGAFNITSMSVGYQVGAASPVIENVSGLFIQPGTTGSYVFNTPFNSILEERTQIKTWVQLNGDENILNDTTYYTFKKSRNLPFYEDFEQNNWLPEWYISSNGLYSSMHGNTSQVMSFNLYQTGAIAEVELPNIGEVAEGDSLSFDYRLTDFETDGAVPHVMGQGDYIVVEISTDCGNQFENIYTINSENHRLSSEMQTIRLSLDEFAGSYIKVAIRVVYGSGDYWVDLDNIGIFGCGSVPELDIITVPESGIGEKDGKITVTTDGSYLDLLAYSWNNGAEGRTINNIGTGTYVLTMEDVFGCTFETSVDIGLLSKNIEILSPEIFSVYPNPTKGLVKVEGYLKTSEKIKIQVFDLWGQLIKTFDGGNTNQIDLSIDLNGLLSGVYIIQLSTPTSIGAKRIILQP